MSSKQSPKVKLDRSKLLGFDQTSAATAAKVGEKPIRLPPPPPPA
jgi:hypothetical protein